MPYHDTYHDAYLAYSDLLPTTPTYFRPPTTTMHFVGRDLLMRRVPFEQGLAVLDIDGQITPFPGLVVVPQRIADTADHVYLGGYVHGPLSDAEVVALTAAGYGAFLSSVPP